MNDNIDDIFRRNIGNVQVPPASSVKTSLVREVSSIIYKKTLFCVFIITASVGVLAIVSGLVFQNINKASNELSKDSETNRTSSLSLNNSSSETSKTGDTDVECEESEATEEVLPKSSELIAQNYDAPHKISGINSQPNYSNNLISEGSKSDDYLLKNLDNQSKRSGHAFKNKTTAGKALKNNTEHKQFHSNLKSNKNLISKTHTSSVSNVKNEEAELLKKEVLSKEQLDIRSLELLADLKSSEFSSKEIIEVENILKSNPTSNTLEVGISDELIEMDKIYYELNSKVDNISTDIHNSNQSDYKSNRRTWALGLTYGYGYYSNSLNSSLHNDDVKKSTSINSKSNYLGALATREVGRLKFSLGAGVERMNQSYTSSIIQHTQEEIWSYTNIYETVIINGNPTEVIIVQENITSLVDKEEEITSDLTNQIDYLQIPFNVGYDLFRGSRFDAGFSAGVIYNKQMNSRGEILNELSGEINSLRQDKSLINNSLYQFHLGLNITRNITPRMSVRVNPRLRIASSKQFDELRIQSTNYSGLDINFGLQIKL